MSIFLAALDLGQLQDYTALVVIEASGTTRMVTMPDGRAGPVEMMPLAQVDVRYVERFPLKTKYAVIAQLMAQRLVKMPTPRYFAFDKTGVGVGVSEMFEQFSPIGITFVGGATTSLVGEQDYHVPKRDLIESAQVLLQNGVMRIAQNLPHAEVLVKELLAFRMKISLGGHDTYEAWRERDHDDIVNALAIGCWVANLIVSIEAARILNSGRGEDPPIISHY